MNDIEIVASRFAVSNGAAIDLATGQRVALALCAAGTAAEQTRWAGRCDEQRTLLRRSGARLVDYGAVGAAQRFEAWTVGGSTVPDPNQTPTLDACGIVLVRRPAVAAIAELFDAPDDCRPRIVSLRGPSGAGKTIVIGELARAARLNGMVPVSTGVLTSPMAAALRGRTLFVIEDDSQGRSWPAVINWAMYSPRPHIILFAGTEEIAGVNGLLLDRVSADALVDAVRPQELTPQLKQRVRRAAEGAGGLPGRFAAALWGLPANTAAGGRQTSVVSGLSRTVESGVRAAEEPAAYGAEENPPSAPATAMVPLAAPMVRLKPDTTSEEWPSPGELDGLRRRMDAAVRLLAEGRHAPGERTLRQAVGGLSRRGDWAQAGQGALALAESLLKRGRVGDAQAALDSGRDYCTRAARGEALVAAATLAGHAWIDLARLDEAENVIAAALAAGAAGGYGTQAADAALAMARCLFWRGRYTDADAVLADLPSHHLPEPILVKLAVAQSRIAVGQRDFSRAVSLAVEACQRAQAARDHDLGAAAACASAFAHLSVCDLEAVERDVASAIGSARAARSPLRAIRARLLLAEGERRRDRRAAAGALLRRATRFGAAGLPPIICARADLLAGLLKADAPAREVVRRHAGATGLAALALLTPEAPSAGDGTEHIDGVVDDFVGILHLCQNAAEEDAVLVEVCGRLRKQLHAAGVAFVAPEHASVRAIAGDGGRVDHAIAQRAIGAGVPISPHRVDDRLEAAAPVRYGGATIAALVARWTIGTSYNLSRAGNVLTIAAAAAAPAVAEVLSRRAASVPAEPTELIGVSPATTELRRAIERAAAAPFCVLIEGESGSGKELVARAVHRCGPRRGRPFCTLNCAALPDDLVESELFGHARGAFTGAVSDRPGVFEEAHGGTLLLDEIGELSLRAQAKVLRVIQEGELRRVGENVGRRIDVRIVSASNRDLRGQVGAGQFRLDLLYRLDVIRIVVSPLRDRREDIAVLAEHIWRDATRRVGSRATLAAATVAALARYDWPGNVRELQNVLAALAVRTPKRGVVGPSALPLQFGDYRSQGAWRLDEARRAFEERFVRAALVRTGGHRTQAAAELGVSRQGLTKLMTRLGITA